MKLAAAEVAATSPAVAIQTHESSGLSFEDSSPSLGTVENR